MISKSIEETARIAREVLDAIEPNKHNAHVITLSGNLGSGKTTFTKAFAGFLGVPENEITSPTFVIMKRYDISAKGFKNLIHIDAYRLEKSEEIMKLGWQALLSDPTNIILIEWPLHVKEAIPSYTQNITFSVIDENTREIAL